MSQKHKKSKIISLLLVSFLFIGIFSAVNVGAEFILVDDTLRYDEFNNDDNIDKISNCTIENGRINLTRGNPTYEYNYAKKPTNLVVRDYERIFLPDNFLVQLISQFISPTLLLGDPITSSAELQKIAYIDGSALNTTGRLLSKINPVTANPVQHYRFTIEQSEVVIDEIDLNWWYGPYKANSNLEKIEMYIWSYGSVIPRWEKVDELEYKNYNINKADGSPDLNYTTNDTRYINDDGHIDILIIGTPDQDGKEAILFTDFINISISTVYGYYLEGYIISDVISPVDFGGWDKVFWKSSKYSEQTGVTIHILDEEYNSTGFVSTDSPFDISGIDLDEIRLKAVLHSNSPYTTPFLYSWGVLWQRDGGYLDTFKTDFRIEENPGTIIEDGKITIDTYYNNWEFFGKKPDNTRQYDGKTIDSKPDSYYWYTEQGFGGLFRSPIVSEEKVYVASPEDNRIYAFNITIDSENLTQKPVDKSNPLPFPVDSCFAATDNYIIVGTAEYNELNKIYALNKSDLSDQVWSYPSGNETICFSAPPVISDGKIFVTSWGGRLFDLPFFSFISQYSFIYDFFRGNNKLICLDIETGTEVWNEEVFLLAGSISAPAVGNDYVYVGCQNMYGNSILAFDSETGEKIWNQTVGTIGRSSPVFADDKIFVLSNKKTNTTATGDYRINCLNALNGEILWNKSINPMGMTNFLKGLRSQHIFYKLIEGFAPITTPAYYKNTLYVVSPNGTLLALESNDGSVKWSADLSGKFIDLSFYTASPLIVGNKIYVVTGDAKVHCFNVNNQGSDVQPVWTYQIRDPDEYQFEFLTPDVIASPILAEGMLLISSTENAVNLSGRIYCLGDYRTNTKGSVKSTTITLPDGKWWSEFRAIKTNTTENTITFSILDKDDNVLKKLTNYNTGFINISDIRTKSIKLYADFNVLNTSEDYPVLDSWEIKWVEEKVKPVFLNETLTPGEDGWVNLELKECSIEVKDTAEEGIFSGMDVNSAEFRIGYIPKGSNTIKYTPWHTATSEDKSGVKQTRIFADIQSLNLDMKELLNIRFRVSDQAGNTATSDAFTFRLDTVKPVSEITNRDELLDEYKDVFVVEATAEDQPGYQNDTNISGISRVILKYQHRNTSKDLWSEWTTFSEKTLDFTWTFTFGKDETTLERLPSGYYRLVTVAVDKAGNHEDITNNKITDSFLLDLISPQILNDFTEVITQKELPIFSIELQDDHMLDGLYYRIDIQTEWNAIKERIDKKHAEIEWRMQEELWVEFEEGEDRIVYFKATDKTGNIAVAILNITKDESIRELYVDLSDFSDWTLDETFKIKTNIPSNIKVKSAELFYRYSADNTIWTGWQQVGLTKTNAPYSWDFTANNRSGYYEFYIKVIDVSGAIYTSTAGHVKLTILPMTYMIILIAIAVIFLIISLFIITKIYNKKQ
jgi:outer membrane protein assembly factor BamB